MHLGFISIGSGSAMARPFVEAQSDGEPDLKNQKSGRQESNLRPHGPKPRALPTALRPALEERQYYQAYANDVNQW